MGNPKPRFRINGRRVARCAVGLILVATGVLILTDVWHQWRVGQEVDELNKLIAQIESEVQGGVPAAAWQESRIQGSNGWPEVAFLWEAGEQARIWRREKGAWRPRTEGPEGSLWSHLDQLKDYSDGEWRESAPENADDDFVPRRVPTSQELRTLLDATQSMPDACRKAGACDTVSPVPLPGTSTEDWRQSLSVFDSLTIRAAMTGRVKALIELKDNTSAASELLTYTRFWSRYNLPLNWYDGQATAAGGTLNCLQLAAGLYEEGKLGDETIREILALPFDGDRLFVETMTGDIVWASLLAQSDDYTLREPGWFEWLSVPQSTPPGSEGYRYALDRFGQRAEYCHGVRATLMHDLQFLQLLQNPRPLSEVTPLDISWEWHGAFSVQQLPGESMEFRRVNVALLELKLRLLERASGPLFDQQLTVEQLLDAQPSVDYRWEGRTLVIFPVPIIEFAPDESERGEETKRTCEVRLDPLD